MIYIVIPTYNERYTLGPLVEEIFSLSIPNLHVLVVDDNSPDGTGDYAETLHATYPTLTILHRKEKNGLGPAYVAGFTEALRHGADYIIAMDADRSHDPAYIPQFLEAIKRCDVVIGSRYVHGGGIRDWNWFRRFISRSGNVYAHVVLGLPFHDVTGGYRCYRRNVLETIKLDQVNSVGYVFQVETIYHAYQCGFRITEIPIVFTERTIGKSKFSIAIMFESFLRVLQLRFLNHRARRPTYRS